MVGDSSRRDYEAALDPSSVARYPGDTLTGLAKALRTAYFRTAAGTLRCIDAEAWRRVAAAAEAWCHNEGNR
jgi:hypothetical protein